MVALDDAGNGVGNDNRRDHRHDRNIEIIHSSQNIEKGGDVGIILLIGIILLALWLFGFFLFTLGALIHIALVLALIFIIFWLLKSIFRLF